MAGLILVVWIFGWTLKNLRRKSHTPVSKRNLRGIKIALFVVGLACIGISQLTFWIERNLSAFEVQHSGVPVGIVSFQYVEDGGDFITISSRAVSDSARLAPTQLVMRSRAASLEIERLDFDESLSSIGLKDFSRISSVHFLGEHGESVESAPFVTLKKDATSFWNVMSKLSKILPLVKATKLTTDPLFFDPGGSFEIHVGESRAYVSNHSEEF